MAVACISLHVMNYDSSFTLEGLRKIGTELNANLGNNRLTVNFSIER